MRARDIKAGFAIRLPSGKIHSTRFGYDANAQSTFSRAARTLCGVRIGNSNYDQFTPAQCKEVKPHSVEDDAEFCGNCYPHWTMRPGHTSPRSYYKKPEEEK